MRQPGGRPRYLLQIRGSRCCRRSRQRLWPATLIARDYTALATIDGKQQKIVGKACRQSDGSYYQAACQSKPIHNCLLATNDPYYAEYEPWLWDAPIGISIGAPFFFDVHRHFHPIFLMLGTSENSTTPGTSADSTTSADPMVVAFHTMAWSPTFRVSGCQLK